MEMVMDSRDRDAISDLFRKLHDVERQAGPRDAEAERMIADESQRLSGAAYHMAQTIIMQDMALNAKQKEVDDLRRQLAETEQRPASGASSEGGFLSRMFGSGSPQPSEPSRPSAARGPWGAPAPSQSPYAQPQGQYAQPQGQYTPPPQPYPQQGYAPQGGGFGRGMGGGGGFLAGAAQTAMGVAGGVVLGNAIGSMFGGHSGGLFGGGEPTEVVNETTNIYEDNRSDGVQQASNDGGWNGNDQGQDDGYQDASYDDGGFDDSGSDDTI